MKNGRKIITLQKMPEDQDITPKFIPLSESLARYSELYTNSKHHEKEKNKKGPNSERAELIGHFLDGINLERKGTNYPQLKASYIAFRISHLEVSDLYHLLKECRRSDSFGRVFFGGIKPKTSLGTAPGPSKRTAGQHKSRHPWRSPGYAPGNNEVHGSVQQKLSPTGKEPDIGRVGVRNQKNMNEGFSVDYVESRMRAGTITPHEMAEFRVYLAGEYSFQSTLLEKILLSKPERWMKMRDDHKSDTATERAWEATEEGKREMSLKFTLKKIEKMLSAASSAIRIATEEARNVM